MWREALVLYLLLTSLQLLLARENITAAVSPQDCSLECVQQGGPGCEYCRVTRADVQRILGFRPIEAFGSCIPWPCFELLGEEDPEVCKHYVHAPNDVTVEFLQDPNPKSDTIVVSWKPSYYGIAFLRGFQVSLQALGGSHMACQLFLFHRNLSLSASHAQRVYKSDPFPGLLLGTQYAITVMALPVPEQWERFYHSKTFSTRSCAEKIGFEQCKKDWYPKHIDVQQNGTDVTVTFNLAPPSLGIKGYFSLCYANGMKKYMNIRPNSSKNTTHHSYQLHGLQEGINYTCEIAADEVDAVRKTFRVLITPVQQKALPLTAIPPLALILLLGLSLAAIFTILLAVLIKRRPKLQMKKSFIRPDIIEHHQQRSTAGEVMLPPSNRSTPPRLLICYSRQDGPAHVRAVMQLGVFIQQHMATKVCLDLWDSLSVAEEGTMGWHCRQIQECDFVLVICSRGLNYRSQLCHLDTEAGYDEHEEADKELGWGSNTSSCAAAIPLIRMEVGHAIARGRDLSKYMTATFEYSEETDIPTELRLVSHYTLTRDLPLLFSHLHGVALHRPGRCLKIEHVSEEGFTKSPAGAALQLAICEASMALRDKELHHMEGRD
ncbi:interleukin-17 receptor D [Myripristis murdjan]|uniref:interleukin-17 receptor D n=1 Tax=Myripristis murdjan TaxID=586833 RepID=UPI0011762E25|nr:interleukin-17 receptor D-like [Myripristis murdjan]